MFSIAKSRAIGSYQHINFSVIICHAALPSVTGIESAVSFPPSSMDSLAQHATSTTAISDHNGENIYTLLNFIKSEKVSWNRPVRRQSHRHRYSVDKTSSLRALMDPLSSDLR